MNHRAFWRYHYRQIRMAIFFVYCVGIVSRHTINPTKFYHYEMYFKFKHQIPLR